MKGKGKQFVPHGRHVKMTFPGGAGYGTPAERDPVERLRRHLDQTGQWTQTFQDVIEAEFGNGFDKALADLRAESENA